MLPGDAHAVWAGRVGQECSMRTLLLNSRLSVYSVSVQPHSTMHSDLGSDLMGW